MTTAHVSNSIRKLVAAWSFRCKAQRKQQPDAKDTSESAKHVISPPRRLALFAVGNDEGRLCRVSRTYLALRSGRRRNLTEVLTKICEDMPFSEVAAIASLFTQDAF